MIFKALRKQKGSSLIEAIVAVLILAIGLVGIAALQINAIKGDSFSTALSSAARVLEQKRDALASMPYTQLNTTSGAPEQVSAGGDVIYAISWTVTENTPVNYCKTVVVTVGWPANVAACASNVNQCLNSQSFTTYVYDKTYL